MYTSGRVQSLAASVALEVLRFLMGDEKLQILKISFACNGVSLNQHAGVATDGQ
jgi:hypothetical protein